MEELGGLVPPGNDGRSTGKGTGKGEEYRVLPPKYPFCEGCGPLGRALSGFAAAEKSRGTTSAPSMSWGRIVSTEAPLQQVIRCPWAFGPEGLVAYLERNELDVPIIVVKRLSVEVR